VHRQLRGIASDKAIGLGPNKVLSVPDAIGIALEKWMREKQGVQQDLLGAAGISPLPVEVVQPNPSPVVKSTDAAQSQFGFDAVWIAEQQRRGFIARKPNPDGEGELINPTKKALTRYGS